MDSWFCSENFIQQVRTMAKGKLHLIAACKMDKRRYDYEGKHYNAKELLRMNKKNKAKRCRKHSLRYVMLKVSYKGIPMHLSLIHI